MIVELDNVKTTCILIIVVVHRELIGMSYGLP